MDAKCTTTNLQSGGSSALGNVFLASFVSFNSCSSMTDYENIADLVYRLMFMIYPNSDGYFQQDNSSCHNIGIAHDWFEENEGKFTLLRWLRNLQISMPLSIYQTKLKKTSNV